MRIDLIRKPQLSISAHEELAGWLFASPWIFGFCAFILGPMLWSIYISFTDFNFFQQEWVGLANYERLLTNDDLVPRALWVTTKYALMSVPLHVICGFLLALLLNQKVKGLGIWRTIFYFPSVLSGVAVIILWILILNPQFGLLNSMLRYIGIRGPNWLGSTDWALPALVLMSLWGVGGSMLIYLAGLQGIPTELYDAAKVDGANSLQQVWYITIPMMSPIIFFNLIVGLISALQTFDIAFIATRGGPAWSTYFYMLHLYNTAFEELKMGYASALAWILFGYIFILTLLIIRFSSGWVFYEDTFKREKASRRKKAV